MVTGFAGDFRMIAMKARYSAVWCRRAPKSKNAGWKVEKLGSSQEMP